MKRTISLFTMAFFALKINPANAQTVTGALRHVPDSVVFLRYSTDSFFQKTDTLKPDKKGCFTKLFHFDQMRTVTIMANDVSYPLIVFPGAKLSFIADFTNYNTRNATFNISGEGSEINIEHLLASDKKLAGIKWDYQLPPDSFVMRLTDWRITKDSLRKKWVNAKASKPYNKYVEQFLRTDSINDLYWVAAACRDYHTATLGGHSTEDSFFRQYVQPFIFSTDEQSFLNSSMYVNFWDRYITDKYSWRRNSVDSVALKDTNWIEWRIQETKRITKGKLQQMILSGLIQYNFAYNYNYIPETEFAAYDSILNKYSDEIVNPEIPKYTLNEIKTIKERRAKTANGKPAPDFELTDSTGKTYTLKDFAGRIIYLDVWASWCGPCIGEMPDYKKLVARLKNKKDIVFVSASIDNDKEAWIEKGIHKHEPPGLQLWAGKGGWKSSFARNYYIAGVPQYILIDRQGKIISFSASRPSSGDKIEKEILEALQ